MSDAQVARQPINFSIYVVYTIETAKDRRVQKQKDRANWVKT